MSELLGKITRSRAPVKSFFLKCCQEFVFSEARRGNRETRVKLLQIKRKTRDGQSRDALLRSGSPRARSGSLPNPLSTRRSIAGTRRKSNGFPLLSLHQIRLLVRIEPRKDIKDLRGVNGSQKPEFVCDYFVSAKRVRGRRCLE